MFSANDFFMLCDGSAIACRAAIPKFYRWRAWRWVLALCLSTTQLLLAADVAPKNRLIVGSELDFPPFALVREGGQADGFTAELWRAVAQEAHLDATIKTGPFHQILEQFKQGEIDVLINLAQSEERARFADFSVPHVRMAGAVFIRKGERGIAVEDDLANKPLIVIRADLAHDYARKRGWTELTLVETAAAGMKLLASSTKHEAMLIGRLVGLQTIRELKLGDIEPLPLKVGFQQDFAFAVRKGNSDLLARINDGLANVRASGAYDAISAKWFGSLDPTPLTMESVLQYLVPAGAAILLLLLAYLRERSLRMRWKSTASKLDATISDLTQAQMSLRESEERFKAFMDRTPGIAFIKDEFGRYVYVNKTWEDIYARDWRGKTDVELWPRDNVAMFNDSDRRALEAGHATEAFETVQDKDGRPQDWWVMKFPIVDAEGKRLLGGMAMDITARNRAERERATLQAAIEQQMEGLALLDNDGRYLYVNPAHAAIYGYKVDELIGRSWKILYEPAQAELLEREHFPSLLETGHWRGELNGRKKNGESFFQEISLTRIHAGYGTDSAVGLICACRDISAEKQKQQKLAEAHVALSHAMPGIGRIDTVGRYLEVNDMYAGMLGFDPEELIGTDWSRTVHFKDRPRALASYERMLEVGKGECEARGVRKDGSTFFKQVLLVKIVDDNGRHVGHHCFMRDITERKRGEEALCQSEQHLIAAQSIVHLGSWEWDFQSGRNSWSDENYRLFGYEPGSVEPIYDSWVNRIHPDDRSRVQEHLSSAFNGTTQCDIEFRVMHPNSEIRFVHWRGELFRDASGNELRMAGTVLDITERKRADEALRQAYDELERRVEERTAELQQAVATLKKTEALLHQAVDVANLGIFERDHDSDEVHYSPTLRKILALPEDRKGSLGEFMAKIHPDDRANVIAARRWSRERAGDGQFSLECRVIRSDGSIGWIMIRSQAFFEGSGDGRRPVRTVGAVLDITERKRAEEALRKLTEDLDRRVVERTRELAESQSRLRSLVAEITKTEERERRRLAVELHDYLAQMLTVSRMNIGRAEKLAAGDALKQRLAEAMESVDESIAYTRSLMAQLSPRMLYDLGLPAALTWLAAQQQERHGLKVEIGGAAEGFALDEECSVLAYQCVRELLWNIVKHAQANQALVSYKIEHCELTVEVADDGRGFDPESLHASGNGVEKFGLFSIRERLELSGGKLEVTSQLGRGTRVRFTLPAPPSEMAPAVAHGAVLTSAVLGNEKQLRIALVDDHTVVRRGMRQMLEEYADLTVVGEAKDGLAGVELAREFRPDVVVMDVNMPRMNGIEATKLILQEMPSTIVVGLSFDNGAEVAQKMKAAGAFTCVTKERAAEDIHQAIVDAVEARRGAAAD